MRATYMIPGAAAAFLMLAGCGGETSAPAAPEAPAVPAPTLAELPAPYNEANLENGASVFLKCRSCHQLQAGKGHMVGPNLHGLFERGTGAAKGFKYSPALDKFEPAMWTPELIDQWLVKPQGFLPGTSMFFNGVPKPEDRRDIIAFLLINSRK